MLCATCLAHDTGLTTSRIDHVLITVGHAIDSRAWIGLCEQCQQQTVVHGLN